MPVSYKDPALKDSFRTIVSFIHQGGERDIIPEPNPQPNGSAYTVISSRAVNIPETEISSLCVTDRVLEDGSVRFEDVTVQMHDGSERRIAKLAENGEFFGSGDSSVLRGSLKPLKAPYAMSPKEAQATAAQIALYIQGMEP
jgi:hypothetical protein